jgi:hypothetical protein
MPYTDELLQVTVFPETVAFAAEAEMPMPLPTVTVLFVMFTTWVVSPATVTSSSSLFCSVLLLTVVLSAV